MEPVVLVSFAGVHSRRKLCDLRSLSGRAPAGSTQGFPRALVPIQAHKASQEPWCPFERTSGGMSTASTVSSAAARVPAASSVRSNSGPTANLPAASQPTRWVSGVARNRRADRAV
jgi:hypothetical protein